jgi:eukaryotic-like serine/threonine-protein kinase
VDPHHAVTSLFAAPDVFYSHPRLSPDGKRIAMQLGEGIGSPTGDVWIADLQSGTPTRVTTGNGLQSAWSPDGRRIYFITNALNGSVLASRATDLSDQVTPVPLPKPMPPGRLSDIVVAPDGQTAVIVLDDASGRRSLHALTLSNAPEIRALSSGSNSEYMPALSPTGRWLAYVSSESGRAEVYVRAYPGLGGHVQISKDGGSEPVWTRDGRQILYRDGVNIVAASVADANGFSVTARSVMVQDDFVRGVGYTGYDVDASGRLIAVRELSDGLELSAVLDWRDRVHAALNAPR